MANTSKPKRFAEGTKVSVEKSHIEVQKLLKQYGAIDSAYGEQGDTATILFTMKSRQYRIQLTYPSVDAFALAGRGVRRTQVQRREAREQEVRRCGVRSIWWLRPSWKLLKVGLSRLKRNF